MWISERPKGLDALHRGSPSPPEPSGPDTLRWLIQGFLRLIAHLYWESKMVPMHLSWLLSTFWTFLLLWFFLSIHIINLHLACVLFSLVFSWVSLVFLTRAETRGGRNCVHLLHSPAAGWCSRCLINDFQLADGTNVSQAWHPLLFLPLEVGI